jgi:hypothetical protein
MQVNPKVTTEIFGQVTVQVRLHLVHEISWAANKHI